MTVSSTEAFSGPFTGNGTNTVFPFTFKAMSAAEVQVRVDGIEISSSLYSVSLAAGGGSVTFATAPVNGADILIVSAPSFLQDIGFENNGAFLQATHDEVADRSAARDIYLKARVDAIMPETLLLSDSRAGKFLAFDVDGNAVPSSGTGADTGLRTDLAAADGDALVRVTPYAGAPALSLNGWLRENDFSLAWTGGLGDGVSDNAAALDAAFDRSNRIVLPPASVDYFVDGLVSKTLSETTYIDCNGQSLRGLNMLQLQTGQLSARTITANIARGATVISLNSTTGLTRGMLLSIQSSVVVATEHSDTKYDLVKIERVDGLDVHLEAGTNFAWTTAENSGGTSPNVYPFLGGADLVLSRPVIDVTATDADVAVYKGLYLLGFDNVRVIDPIIRGVYPFTRDTNTKRNGISLYYCNSVEVQNAYVEAMSYGIVTNGGCRNIQMSGVRSSYCRHAVEIAGWSSDATIRGIRSMNDYMAFSAHPSLRLTFQDVRGQNGMYRPAPRSIGHILRDIYVHSLDNDDTDAQFDAGALAVGYTSMYADADFLLDNVIIHEPNNTDANIRHRYGRTVRYANVKAIDAIVGLSGSVERFHNLPGNDFSGKQAPSAANVVVTGEARSFMPSVLKTRFEVATLDLYHIDPRATMMDQPTRQRIECEGVILDGVAADTYRLSFHLRPFALADVTDETVVARVRFRATLQHESAGVFSEIQPIILIRAIFGGGDSVEVVVVDAGTAKSGVGAAADITFAIASGGAAGEATESPVIIDAADGQVTLGITLGSSGAVTNGRFDVSHDTEIVRTEPV